MPRRSAPRSVEEEEEYRRRRRERNTEIQRERRRRLKALRDGGGLTLRLSGPTFVTYGSMTDSTPSPDPATEFSDDQPPQVSSPNPIEADSLLPLSVFNTTSTSHKIQRRRRMPLLPTRKKRTPEEEAAYAAHRRARNTEIQRRRRQRMKEESMLSATTSPTSSTSSSSTDSSTTPTSFDQNTLLTVLQFCLAQIQTTSPSIDSGSGATTP